MSIKDMIEDIKIGQKDIDGIGKILIFNLIIKMKVVL